MENTQSVNSVCWGEREGVCSTGFGDFQVVGLEENLKKLINKNKTNND